MSDSAHVTSIEAVARFAAAVREFRDDASNTLLGLDQQVSRGLHWVEHEAPALWRQRIHQATDEVARTRSAWENCRLRVVAGEPPACIEEEQAFRAAKRRLEVAEKKPELVRHWANRVRNEIDEYRGRVGRLGQFLDSDLQHTLGLLDRMQAALDSYAGRTTTEES